MNLPVAVSDCKGERPHATHNWYRDSGSLKVLVTCPGFAVTDGMPWADAARDYGDVPIDDDTGQPSQPPGVLSDTWEATVTLTRRLSDGSPYTVSTGKGEDADPHRAVAKAWLNTGT